MILSHRKQIWWGSVKRHSYQSYNTLLQITEWCADSHRRRWCILVRYEKSPLYTLPARELSTAQQMNGSIIKDIYIDTAHRIWNVIYPTGLTVYSEQYPAYEWITHSRNNTNSLVDNRINGIMQDSEGDTWFATNNGISCYNPTSKKWRNYLSSFDQNAHNDNHVFISLCELRPGVVMAGGYMSGIYLIYKNTQQVRYISQLSMKRNPFLINTSEAFYVTTTVISGLADFIVYVCSIPVMVNATVMIRSTPLHSYLPRMKTLFG